MIAAIEVLPIKDEPNLISESHRWKPASTASKKDAAESQRVQNKVRAIPQQCWFNARNAVLKLSDYSTASYVEGWAIVGGGLRIEHGWIVRDGQIIDPTLPNDSIIYFPGLEFVGRTGILEFLSFKAGKKCKKSPFFFAFGWGGM